MRLLLTLFLCLPALLFANTGPGTGVPLPHSRGLDLEAIINQALSIHPEDAVLECAPTEAEQLAMAAAFSAPTAISDRGDDLRKVAALSDSARAEIAKIRGVLDLVRSEARQISSLTGAALESLPLGIHQRIGNIDVHLAIAEARLTATQAEVDLYLGLDLPNTTQDPIFIARGIGWSRQGGFTGNIDLELVSDWGIDFNSGASRIIIKRTQIERDEDGKTIGDRVGTYVTIDCDGFVAGRLDATVLVSRDWVIPVNNRVVRSNESLGADSLNLTVEDRVHADFSINIRDGEGFLAEVNLEQAFVFANKKDVQITVGAIAIDLSDAVNPSEMFFPENYHSPHVVEGFAEPTWQGFYLRGLEIRLPDQYAKETGDTLVIGAPYLILDRSGFTGHFFAENILDLGDKSADGWAFSVDTFDLKITQNTFESAKITGLINVPLLAGAADACYVTLDPNAPVGNIRRQDCLGYGAHFSRSGLDFSVRTSTLYCVNLWKADLVIEENSRIDLSYRNGQFDASATLNGTLLIDADVSPNFKFTMDSLSFDNLTLSNREPHFSPGVWDFPKSITAKLKNFDLSFTHIGLTVDSLNGSGTRLAALNFNAKLNVDGDMKLNCEGMFKLTGYLAETEGKQQWRFQKLRMRAFKIDASTDSWGIKAAIAFYEHDQAWGTGFYGAGTLRISALGGSEIAAVAQFGSIRNDEAVEEKYFFVDVMAKFGNGITLPGGVQLMGIGGGVYKNMTRATPIGQSFASPNNTQITQASSGVAAAAATQSPFNQFLGESTSGIRYEVDLGNRFGAFLQVIIAGENEEAFSVNARLELEVRDDGGWRAALDGNVTIMGPVNFDNDPKITEGVGIFIHMSYVKSETYSGFKATADVFVNIKDNTIAGGLADSTGVTDTEIPSDTARQSRLEFVAPTLGYAGNISLEFSSDQWYIHIGYPKFDDSPMDKRIALSMQILGAGVGTASYFCVGQNVPPIPPLPRRVRSIVGEMDMSRDFAQYESASGFAFGTELSLVANGQFLIFYFDLEAGIGFDINVRNYGDAICAGDDPDGEGIGVNGWYAAGQAYAYIEADVGIQAPWWLGGFRVNILDAGVAAVLQVKAPNPVWAKGVVAGYYNVLGGALRGNFRVEGEFGDNCVITGRDGDDPFASLNVISSMNPDSLATDVATNTEIKAYLVLPIEEASALGDREYQARVINAELKEVASGQNVDGFRNAARGSYLVEFSPKEFLKGSTDYLFTLTVEVRARNVGASSWETPAVKTETRVHPFRTAEPSLVLHPENIKYSYPMPGQVNFYRNEEQRGFLGVHRKQPNLTENITAVYQTNSGREITAEATWENGNRKFTWQQPTLQRNKAYRFSLVQNYQPAVVEGGNNGGYPGSQNNNNQQEAPGAGQNQLPGGGNGLPDGGPNAYWFPDYAPIHTEEAVANAELVSFYFRTSRYRTFADKLNAVFDTYDLQGSVNGPSLPYSSNEVFDSTEVIGGTYGVAPLIQMRITEDETFLARGLGEYVFENLPFSCPSDVPDYQKWQNIDADIPWEAVTLLNLRGPITATDFALSTVGEVSSGGELLITFANTVMAISIQVERAAYHSLELVVEESIDNYLNTEPGEPGFSIDLGPYGLCFPSMADVLSEVHRPTSADIDLFLYTSQIIQRDLLDGNPPNYCDLPDQLIEMAGAVRNLNLTRGDNNTYPVKFTYRLPDGRTKPPITLTFQY